MTSSERTFSPEQQSSEELAEWDLQTLKPQGNEAPYEIDEKMYYELDKDCV